MDEVDLRMDVRRRSQGRDAGRGTHTVRQVGDEVLDFDFASLQFAIQPALFGQHEA